MQIYDLGLMIDDLKRRRRGVSILEVMFAILVTTIGLLGAIAIFPVASAQARKGKLNDMAAVAGISAVHDFDARGMRNPNTWLYYDTGSSNYAAVPLTNGNPAVGAAFFIDPGFMAAAPANNDRIYFPYYDTNAGTAIEASSDRRMNRITLQAYPLSGGTAAMSGLQAETQFAIGDDLAYVRPDDRSLTAEQLYVRDSTNTAYLRRETEGMLTWAATLAPKVDYDIGTGLIVNTDLYILSVLVFDRRNVVAGVETLTTLDNGLNAVNPERLVDVKHFEDAGIGGGEVVLAARPGRNAGDLELKAGDWVMLSGYKNDGSGNIVGPLFLWYQVANTDPEVNTTVSPPERYVTLRGPDWPLFNVSGTTSYTQATIMTGLVAVYEKTVRLDTSN